MIILDPGQRKAIAEMKNGCILCGGVGSGKSRTALAYYYREQGGDLVTVSGMQEPKDLYIITTARKRDTLEWEGELAPFALSTDPNINPYSNRIVIDSWNNIKKYRDVTGAFFIFDEQRVVGRGQWVKSFLRIARRNKWILLSATPGDQWTDYIPVFVANGFYRNRTDFFEQHVITARVQNYPVITGYHHEGLLIKHRRDILVDIDFERPTTRLHQDCYVEYNRIIYKEIVKDRWNIFENKPIENVSEYCSLLRRVVNSDPTRGEMILYLANQHPKLIVFYNFDFELDILKKLPYKPGTIVAEWNGHEHQVIPNSTSWIYLVQYTAGAEGWNCIETDAMAFFSQSYSYRAMEQAEGRIDRRNTPFKELYYYHLKSRSPIDIAIARALEQKKDFNVRSFDNSH